MAACAVCVRELDLNPAPDRSELPLGGGGHHHLVETGDDLHEAQALPQPLRLRGGFVVVEGALEHLNRDWTPLPVAGQNVSDRQISAETNRLRR